MNRRTGMALLFALVAGFALAPFLRDSVSPRDRSASDGRELADRPGPAEDPDPDVPADFDGVRGRVVTKGSDEPVPGARVIVEKMHVRVTDADGRFTAPRPAGEYVQFRVLSGTHHSLLVAEKFAGKPIVLEMEPGLTIAGRVVTENGNGVPGYQLQAHGGNEAWTDDEGRFQWGGHAPGAVEFTMSDRRVAVVAGTTDARLVLDGSYLYVRVVDDAGEPVAGARLGWLGERTEETGPVEGGRAWQDYFLIRHAPGEGVKASLTKDGYLPQELDWTPSSAGAGVSRESVVMTRRPPNSILIDVRRADDSKPALATITLKDGGRDPILTERIVLDGGQGRVEGVPVGRYDALVWGDGDYALGVEQVVEIRPGHDSRAEFRLRPGAVFAVLSPEHGEHHYPLELRSTDEPERRYRFSATRSRGWLGLPTRLPLGRYRLLEIDGQTVVEERAVEITGTDPVYVTWREE